MDWLGYLSLRLLAHSIMDLGDDEITSNFMVPQSVVTSQMSCFLSAQSIPTRAAKSEGFGCGFILFNLRVKVSLEHAIGQRFGAGIIGVGVTTNPEYALRNEDDFCWFECMVRNVVPFVAACS